MYDCIGEYKKYAASIGDRRSLYRAVAEKFNIASALYPGSHIDIAPSFVIPKVTYIDNFKGAIAFFRNIDKIRAFIASQKTYEEACEVVFYGKDYSEKIETEKVDLIISQFAGFVGQATKEYLKDGGILLCNDSHGDATMAFLDDDYELVGTVDSRYRIITTDLDKYFCFARKRDIDKEKVLKSMKGPKYKHMADNYLFSVC